MEASMEVPCTSMEASTTSVDACVELRTNPWKLTLTSSGRKWDVVEPRQRVGKFVDVTGSEHSSSEAAVETFFDTSMDTSSGNFNVPQLPRELPPLQ